MGNTSEICAIVLSEEISGEANKRLCVFAKDIGKTYLSAKGARKFKSGFLASSQQFCISNFSLYSSTGFNSVTQAELLEDFAPIKEDIFRFAYGCYALEIVEKTILQNVEQNDIFRFLRLSLKALATTDIPPRLWASAFALRYLKLLGYSPEVCHICSNDIQSFYWSKNEPTFICENCKKGERLPEGLQKAARHALSSPINRTYSFRLSEELEKKFFVVSKALLSYNLDIYIKTLNLIREIERI